MIKIPTFQDQSANASFLIELDVQLVTLYMKWNPRNEFFHLDFTGTDGNTLTGIKMVPGWPLLDYNQGSVVFDGDLVIIKDDENLGSEITYDNFGNGYNLYYLTEDEVETWKTENGL